MIPYYDAHNHLQDERIADDPATLPERGLKLCVVNGTREEDWPQVEALAKRFDWIIPAYGLHPWFLRGRSEGWLDSLRRYLDGHPRACVGEIGLDRWMENPDVDDQEKVFAQQLELAAERNVAASIHCLKAWGPLERELKARRRPARGFLIHSYGGSTEMIPALEKLGAYFSISGHFAHARKAAQREVFKRVPLDRLLIETDAPDMAPPPELINGRTHGPREITAIYQFVAELRGVPLETLAAKMEKNFAALFLNAG